MTKTHWDTMLPHEFVQAQNAFNVCYMPYGLAEPHGGFNALGLDFHKAHGIITQTAKTYGGIVAPPFAWHIQDLPDFHDNGQGRGWLCDVGVKRSLASSLPYDLFLQNVLYHIRAFDAAGFKVALLVTGHGGGPEANMRLLAEFYTRRTGSPMKIKTLMDFSLIDPSFPHRGDHAGITETSQLMALHRDMVDLSKTTAPPELGEKFAGFVDFSKTPLPSQEIGEKIIASQVKNLGALAQELLASCPATPNPHWRAPSLNDTAALWTRFERATRRYWYGSYKESPNPTFPGWENLGE
jgi:creatinine amidohydrolase